MTEPSRPSRVESDVFRSVTLQRAERGPAATLVRLITDRSFALRAMRYALRLPTPLRTEDRRVLEQIIFPYYASRPDVHTVLFVGCQWYTSHYNRKHFPAHEYWTIEPDAEARRFGARRHVVAPLEQLDAHFPENFFDLIICNGVYGFGLDAPEHCETALAHCYSRLRPGGTLVFGWTDVPARTPVPLESISSLQRFAKAGSSPLGGWRYVTNTPYAHTYDFYTRPAKDTSERDIDSRS